MVTKSLIIPEKKRIMAAPFTWIDRRFYFAGFFNELDIESNLLYFFLILVSDKDGLSFYGDEKICENLKITFSDLIKARENLIRKDLIAYRKGVYQILILPISKNNIQIKSSQNGEIQFRSLKEIFKTF
jgi:hypothetical protein